ncbi:MAG TPA: alpha/beta hydrolase [Anaerolineales bacterium]|nr:alpha/beta hydrolase [Anaerolineales bacterium]
MELEHSTIETNGINLHIVQAGPQSGVPVMLLHGFPEFWYGWRKQIPALVEAGCRVIVPDQRGYNLSDKPKGVKNYSVNILVEDIVGVIDALGYEKVNLVGHDWGGIVAWALATRNPERLHKLTVMNAPHPAVMRKTLSRDLDQFRRSWYAIAFQLPWLPEFILSINHWQRFARSLQSTSKADSFTDEDIAKYKEAWSQPDAMTSMLNWYRASVRNPSWASRDMHIKVPTLMMWGMKDFALTHRMARPSMDYVDEGNLILFPEATHWVQHDAAEEVNHYLIDFILDMVSQIAVR